MCKKLTKCPVFKAILLVTPDWRMFFLGSPMYRRIWPEKSEKFGPCAETWVLRCKCRVLVKRTKAGKRGSSAIFELGCKLKAQGVTFLRKSECNFPSCCCHCSLQSSARVPEPRVPEPAGDIRTMADAPVVLHTGSVDQFPVLRFRFGSFTSG